MSDALYIKIESLCSIPPRGGRPARVGRYPINRSTLWRWIAKGQFPSPVKMGGVTCWHLPTVEQWEVDLGTPGMQARRKLHEALAAKVGK